MAASENPYHVLKEFNHCCYDKNNSVFVDNLQLLCWPFVYETNNTYFSSSLLEELFLHKQGKRGRKMRRKGAWCFRSWEMSGSINYERYIRLQEILNRYELREKRRNYRYCVQEAYSLALKANLTPRSIEMYVDNYCGLRLSHLAQ